MKLLVDMGNSLLKWVTVSEGAFTEPQSLAYEDLDSQLRLQLQTVGMPETITVSCVANEQHFEKLVQHCEALWKKTPQRVISPGRAHGIVNAYDDPGTLGSDRWATLVAVHELYNRDVCIVDCGTAMTIDLLTASGQHLGGVIVPGAYMMQNSLHLNTAALPQQSEAHRALESGEQLWGQDTQSGIMKGSWLALAGAVEQVYRQFAGQTERPVCVLCGSGASLLARYLARAVNIKPELEPDLVLKGLAVIAGESIKP